MALFKLLAGAHIQDGREYKAGDVVEADHDLAASFRLKFEEVDGHGRPSKGRRIDNPTPLPGMDMGLEEPNKAEKAPKGKAAKAVEIAEPEAESDAKPEANAKRGRDVTEEFPLAAEEDFKVYRRRGLYTVVDIDDPSKPVAEGIAKTEVDKVIKKALKG